MIAANKPPIRRGDKGWNARRYKYRAGAAFGPQLPATGFWQVTVPLTIIRAYRHIPAGVRSVWSMGSSTSHIAETAVAAGGGWVSFRRYSGGWRFLPTYAVGAGLRHIGLASLLLRVMPGTSGTKVPWDNPPMPKSGVRSEGWGDPFKHVGSRGEPFTSPWYGSFAGSGWGGKSNWPSDLRHVSVENKELPDWFPTTGMHTPPPFLWSFSKSGLGPDWMAPPFMGSGWFKSTPQWRPNAAMPDGIPGWIAGKMSVGSDWDTPRNSLGIGGVLMLGLLSGLTVRKSGVIDKGWLAS